MVGATDVQAAFTHVPRIQDGCCARCGQNTHLLAVLSQWEKSKEKNKKAQLEQDTKREITRIQVFCTKLRIKVDHFSVCLGSTYQMLVLSLYPTTAWQPRALA